MTQKPTDEAVEKCPTCGAHVRIEGRTTQNYVPVADERLRKAEDRVKVLEVALNWIGAIAIAPPISWPHYLTIAKVANEALKEGE